MVGIKAILDALQLLGRSTELLETLSQTEYPSLGNFVTAGATALWSDWGDRMTASGEYYSGAGRCADGCAESYSAAWLSLAVKYYYTVWAGILQDDDSAGYIKPLLTPNIPWADPATGESYGGPERSLEFVRASMETPHGRISSAWERNRAESSLIFEFVVPNGTMATVVLPVAVPRSNISVVEERTGSVVYSSVVGGVLSSNITVVGSYVALLFDAVPAGHHRFKLKGTDPAVVACISAGKLSCPNGMTVLSIAQAVFGKVTPPAMCGATAAVGCSAGSARYCN